MMQMKVKMKMEGRRSWKLLDGGGRDGIYMLRG
jgi:hypothetical protein